MNRKMIKIPILSAAAFFALYSGGCAQRSSETESASLYETFSEQTQETTTTETKASPKKTSTAAKRKAKASSKKTEKTTAGTSAVSETAAETEKYKGLISSPKEFEIYDVNGNGTEYGFKYNEQYFEAEYTAEPENWKIIDSYKITDRSDMEIICKALSDIHPIHGSDYTSYRTPEDMAYEWEQHNLAYKILPGGNSWREHAKDVDLDPEDQGKNIYELYKARTGGDLF